MIQEFTQNEEEYFKKHCLMMEPPWEMHGSIKLILLQLGSSLNYLAARRRLARAIHSSDKLRNDGRPQSLLLSKSSPSYVQKLVHNYGIHTVRLMPDD